MPITQIDFPILQSFFCVVANTTGLPPQPLDASTSKQLKMLEEREKERQQDAKPLPKGIVLGPDGKPCRTCTDTASWRAMMRGQSSPFSTATGSKAASTSAKAPVSVPAAPSPSSPSLSSPFDCPPDVDQLGNHTWTFLHTLTATYPTNPTPTQQSDTRSFISLFGKMYPCWVCADDFRAWMKESGNEPRVSSREEFGRWMCEAHNAVNVKLGKEAFDCGRWEERWRTGWKDGRCD